MSPSRSRQTTIAPSRGGYGRTLWSLDAPLVAVVWQRWWARSAGVQLGWAERLVLALAVWMIYLADRLVDSGWDAPTDHGTARHAFYQARRAGVWPLVGIIAGLLTVVTPWGLTRWEFTAGLSLLAAAGGYFWMTHRWSRRAWTAIVPKEGAVGALFALGSFLFVGCRAQGWTGVVSLALAGFAVLCFLNCALITRWEGSARDQRDPASLPNAFPGVARRLGGGCWGLAGLALGFWWIGGNPVFLPLAVSAGLLGGLDHCRARLSVDALRVWADVVLLTPAAFLAFVR